MIVNCPCCGKPFKRLGQHLYHKPKCANYMKHYITELNSNIIGFLPSINSNINSTQPPLKTASLLDVQDTHNKDDDILEDDIHNQDYFYDMIRNYKQTFEVDSVYGHGINYQNFICHQNLDSCNNQDFFIQLQLLQILEEIGAPLYTFDKVMEWCTRSFQNGYRFPYNFLGRKKMISQLSNIFCMRKMIPQSSSIQLHNGQTCLVNHFDFEQMCYSILSDSNIMQDDNFNFGNNNPECFRKSKNDILSCIEDGEMFQNTLSEVCHDTHDFLLGIKMFIDATHTDIHGDWILDPVSFTFTFFDNKITRQHNAWRTLGFITDLNKKSSAWNQQITAANKIIDYHSQLRVIFNSIAQCQKRGGFYWDFGYQNSTFKLRMKPVLILVVGDAMGNHKLAGMYNNFSNTNRFNHSCDCPSVYTDRTDFKCKFVNQSDIDTLYDLEDKVTLNKLSHHPVNNAFRSIQIGNHEAGINAMMPAEILHQLYLGVMENVLECFVASFSPKGKSRMDKFGKFMYYLGKRTSDRSVPIFKTKNGFTNLTKQKGSDRLGICLLLLIIMVSDYQDTLMLGLRLAPSSIDRKNYTHILHSLICLSEWLSNDQVNLTELEKIHLKIINLMKLIKRTAIRKTENGWKTCKFHELLHIIRDVRLFGPPTGYDGRPGESTHKDTKMHARRTQMRIKVFESQTCHRIYENLVINKGSNYSRTHHKEIFATRKKASSIVDTPKLPALPSYFIYKDSNDKICISEGNISEIHQFIFDKIYHTFSHLFFDARIPCRNKINIANDVIVRASQQFYDGTPWNDCVWIKWEYGNENIIEVPAKIFCFVDFRGINAEYLTNHGLSPEIFAYICSMKGAPVKNKSSRVTIIKNCCLETDIDENLKFRFVQTSAFTRPCYIIPNISSLEDQVDIPKKWLYIEPKEVWSNQF